jgi:hypothetical protein
MRGLEISDRKSQLDAGAAEPELAGPPELVVVVSLGFLGASLPPPHAMPARAPATARINTIATFFIVVLLPGAVLAGLSKHRQMI